MQPWLFPHLVRPP